MLQDDRDHKPRVLLTDPSVGRQTAESQLTGQERDMSNSSSQPMHIDTEALLKKDSLWQRMKKNRQWYWFVIPAVVFYAVFRYWPLYFVQIAFRSFRITRSVWDSPWVGWYHFERLFTSPGFLDALRNTIIIGVYKLVFGWPIPILLALLLNELRSVSFKRVTQTLIYLPHFISWVIIGGILMNLLSVDGGLFNEIRSWFGKEPIMYLASKAHFRGIIVLSDIWKDSGWGTIIYLAAISRVNPELYESAHIDGANRLQQVGYITIPAILDVVVVLLILRLGRILSVDFQQILVLLNPVVRPVGDVLQTYVYRVGLQQSRFAFAAAAGLFTTLVAAIMLFSSDRVAKQLGQRGLF
jgi:putative aldouronate transport system permease protein